MKSREVKLAEESGRFWGRVDKSSGPDACWPWTGCTTKNKHGYKYGVFHIFRDGKWKQARAHNYAFVSTFGPLEPGLIVMHVVCDNPPCSNPSHLAKGTHEDNMNDKIRKGRQSKGEKHSLALLKNRPRGATHYLKHHPEKHPVGEAVGTAKVTVEIVRAIRQEYIPRKVSSPFLSKKYGIDTTQVFNIVKKVSWAHV